MMASPALVTAAPETLRVLVVDDNASLLRFLVSAFSANGCIVTPGGRRRAGAERDRRRGLRSRRLRHQDAGPVGSRPAARGQGRAAGNAGRAHHRQPLDQLGGLRPASRRLRLPAQAVLHPRGAGPAASGSAPIGRSGMGRCRCRPVSPRSWRVDRPASRSCSSIGDLALQGLETVAFVEQVLRLVGAEHQERRRARAAARRAGCSSTASQQGAARW